MNCANHPDRERIAFCQHCGKPLCAECVRNVGASVFCEPCLAARVNATAPPPGYPYPYPGARPAVYPPAAPSPTIATLLGFIPGVGAMYNEQYAKGIVHLIVFAILTSLWGSAAIFGLFAFGWIIYMVFDARHTATARRDGTPLPNPFGLNDLGERLGFGHPWPTPGPSTSAPDPAAPNPTVPGPTPPPSNYAPPVAQWAAPPMPPIPPYPDPSLPHSHRIPTGAIWLIGLGVFFLVGNTGIFHIFRTHLFGPLLIIGVGVWLFVSRMLSTGPTLEDDGTAAYRWRLNHALNSSFWVVLIGVIWLLDSLGILTFRASWPLFLIAGGVAMLFRRIPGYGYPPPQQPAAPVTSTELAPLAPHDPAPHDPNAPHTHPGDADQEGR
jgi:TM2 domain-containing membrane protein YozV